MRDLTLEIPVTLRSVMTLLSKSGEGIVFLTENQVLVASLTDGDARRAILRGVSLESQAIDVANRNVKTLTLLSSAVEIHQAFSPGITHIPILNQSGQIEKILRPGEKTIIPLCEPNLGKLESSLVNQAIDTNWVSSSGSFVGEFEASFSSYVQSEFAVSVCNGTMGLALALKLLEIGPGDEVLIPDLTFGATANAVIQVGATPVFVDVLSSNFSIDVIAAEAKVTDKTKAIIPVHLYGNAAPMEEILTFAQKFSLKVVEDAAEAIGTRIDGQHVGTFGDIGVFSFFANKTITTGEGGMIVLNDKELFTKARMMRSHGFTPENRYWHQMWGTNMRLTNLQAALGVAQMRRIDELVEAKSFIADCYMNSLSSIKGKNLILPSALPNVNHSHWLFTIQLIDDDQVDELQNYLQVNHIESRRFFHPLHNQPAFREYSAKNLTFPVADQLYRSGLCLPSSTSLNHDEIKLIAHKIVEYFETNSKTLSN
jgi:perosamine synthetase